MSLETQIKKLKELGLSTEEICQGMEVDKSSVKFAAEEDIDEETWGIIKRRVLRIAATTEDEWLAGKLGMFLWEQKRGKPPTRGGNEGTINIQKVNALIMAASQRADEDLEKLVHETLGDGRGDKGAIRGEEKGKLADSSSDGGGTEHKDPIPPSFNPPP